MNILMLIKIMKCWLGCFLFLTLASVSAKDAAMGSSRDWQSPYLTNHELVDKIWDTHKDSWISINQFHNELLHYDYILLGETHSNADHHNLQAEVINSLVKHDVKPSVVMEMLSHQNWQDQPHRWGELSHLQEKAVELNDGWPWELYAPILQAIVEHKLELYAGNISSAELHSWVSKQGVAKTEDIANEYSYSNENFKTLKKNIIDSHCGYGGEEFVNSMSHAQMQRDRVMADSINGKDLPVVFIAGSGHVRNDYAVPMQLRKKYKQTSYISVAFISVQEGVVDPQAYLQNNKPIYDILFFTPSDSNQDPCEKFRKQLKNMQHRQTP